VIEPRDRRWGASGLREELWQSHLARFALSPARWGPLLGWPCLGVPWFAIALIGVIATCYPANHHSLPALGAPRGGSPWEPKLLSGFGAAWAVARTRRPIRQRKKPANLSFSGRVGGRRSGLSDRATSGPTRRPDRSERPPILNDR
jgi:hypothetical protein